MFQDNAASQEQSAQEETHPESLDHEELEASEMENVSGGMGNTKTQPCTLAGTGCAGGIPGQ